MKKNINNLYLGKIRHCIIDIIMEVILEEKSIKPRPDYIEYYTIIMKKEDEYIDIFNPKNDLKLDINSNELEYYEEDLIIELEPFSNFLNIKDKLSNNEINLVFNTIEKTRKLERKLGYVKRK